MDLFGGLKQDWTVYVALELSVIRGLASGFDVASICMPRWRVGWHK